MRCAEIADCLKFRSRKWSSAALKNKRSQSPKGMRPSSSALKASCNSRRACPRQKSRSKSTCRCGGSSFIALGRGCRGLGIRSSSAWSEIWVATRWTLRAWRAVTIGWEAVSQEGLLPPWRSLFAESPSESPRRSSRKQLRYLSRRPSVPSCRRAHAARFQLLGDGCQRDVDRQLGLGSVGGAPYGGITRTRRTGGLNGQRATQAPHHGPASRMSRATAVRDLFLL